MTKRWGRMAFFIAMLAYGLLAGCQREASERNDPVTVKTDADEAPDNKDELEAEPEEQTLTTAFGGNVSYPTHANAPTTYKLPTLQVLDPRTFTPSGSYTPGLAAEAVDLGKHAIVIPDDGRAWTYPACSYPFAAPGHENPGSLSIDGSFADWPSNSVVAIDRAGDGPNQHASYDIRALRWAADSQFYYVGFEMAQAWAGSDTADLRVSVLFTSLSLPQDSANLPQTEHLYRFDIIGDQVWATVSGRYRRVTQGIALVRAGNNIEFRLTRSDVPKLQSVESFAVNTFSFEYGSGRDDTVGAHIVGLTDDYACLVPLPNPRGAYERYKMLVMRRDKNVPSTVAEAVYRTFVASAASATYATNDLLDRWDNISIIALGQMSAAGLAMGDIALFMEQRPMHYSGERALPLMNFSIAAHEYLHSYNSSEYALPASWAREGHSDWFALQTLQAHHGRSVYQFQLQYQIYAFLDEERQNGNSPITVGDDLWQAEPYTALYYYRKASTFWGLLLERLGYDELLSKVLLKPATASAFANSAALLQAITTLPSYRGQTGEDIGGGWVAPAAGDQVLTYDAISDADHDGAFAFQEASWGTDPSKPDTDGDGLSDTSEWVLGLDARQADSYSFLVPDNYLADWERNAPSLLIASPQQQGNASSCSKMTNIVRYGLAQSGNRLLIAAELGQAPDVGAPLELVVFIEEPQGPRQIIVGVDAPYFYVKNSDNSLLRTQEMLAAFNGSQIEMALQGDWMGWANGVPAGTSFRIATYHERNQCDYTPLLRVGG